MMKMKIFVCLTLLPCCLGLFDHGASGVGSDEVSVSVIEGYSVTLHTSVLTHQQDSIIWYYKGIRIAQINRDESKICTDVQCEDGDERFRDRLKLDHQTGSLTIMNTRNTDSGEYTLRISSSSDREEIFSVSVHGTSVVGSDGVSVMEGGSFTLNTGVQTNQQHTISWYYNDICIAQIITELSNICTDVQCNEGTERFRDRLKLDHQTGSLTIMNITNTDAGEYTLMISSGSSNSEKIFIFFVPGDSAAERDGVKRKSVMEGESVILYPGVIRKLNDVMTWYFNEILIAEITGDQSKICTDVQCKERFTDRLKLDHQTGSLTITDTRNSDSGEYKLLINNSRFSIIKSFSVPVTALPDSGLSSAAIAGICVAVVLLVAAAVIHNRHNKQKGDRVPHDDHDQKCEEMGLNGREETNPVGSGTPLKDEANGQPLHLAVY